jgi:hypothetical protein
MAGNLNNIPAIQARVEAQGFRETTKQELLDTLQSEDKVGGCFSSSAATTPMTLLAGWNRIDVWERSIDTQGLTDGLTDPTDPGGWYEIDTATEGSYTMGAKLRFSGDTAGDYNIQIGGASVYRDAVTLGVGEQGLLLLTNCIVNSVPAGTRIQLEMSGPNGAVVTITYGQFGMVR